MFVSKSKSWKKWVEYKQIMNLILSFYFVVWMFILAENVYAKSPLRNVFVIDSSKKAQTKYEEKEVRFKNGKIELAGTLILPQDAALSPAVVIIHGSGGSDRSNPWTAAYAKALAQRGIAVLYPDKRGAGKSQGDWKTASFSDLADDAIAGVEVLRKIERIDKDRIGVIGFSQGGHIVPLAAARSPAIAFAIGVSGSTVPILEQISDELEISSERNGLTEKQKNLIKEINGVGVNYALTGKGWNKYQSLLSRAKNRELIGQKIVEGFPSEQNHWVINYIRAIGNYDPMPYWEKLSQPALFIYGGQDTNIRINKSIRRIENTFGSTKRNYAVMLFQNNGHTLYREDLMDFLARWITDKGVN